MGFNKKRKDWIMVILTLMAGALLFGYLFGMARKHGIPNMVSDTYYQLGKRGWLFSVVLVAVAIMMMIALLDTGKGVQCLAFMGCGGLAFVGMAPNYLSQDEYPIHKGGAIVAALGCVGWCLTVNVWPTIVLGSLYALYLVATDISELAGCERQHHPWYWAEVACFGGVFVSYGLA